MLLRRSRFRFILITRCRRRLIAAAASAAATRRATADAADARAAPLDVTHHTVIDYIFADTCQRYFDYAMPLLKPPRFAAAAYAVAMPHHYAAMRRYFTLLLIRCHDAVDFYAAIDARHTQRNTKVSSCRINNNRSNARARYHDADFSADCRDCRRHDVYRRWLPLIDYAAAFARRYRGYRSLIFFLTLLLPCTSAFDYDFRHCRHIRRHDISL